MQTADFDVADFEKGNRAPDKRLNIRFFTKARQDMHASTEAGRPIFKEVEYIQVMTAGDRNQAIVRPIAPLDLQRFGAQYDHWKKTQNNDMAIGTPLEAWNILTLSQIEEFKYFGIRTIDQMAELRDDIAGKITGAVALKQKAIAFLAIMKEEAPMRKVQAELDKRDLELATLKTAIADQAKLIADLQKKK